MNLARPFKGRVKSLWGRLSVGAPSREYEQSRHNAKWAPTERRPYRV